MANENKNGGYLMPDKGAGRVNVNGDDIWLACAWVGADRQELSVESKTKGNGQGTLRPNDRKTAETHPDWKGQWIDAANKKWDMAAWSRDKNGDLMFSLKVSDPDAWRQQRAAAGNASAPSSSAPAPAPSPAPSSPPADPNAQKIDASDFDNLEFNDPFNPA